MKEEEQTPSAVVGALEHVESSRLSIPTSETAGEEGPSTADRPKEGVYDTFRAGFRRGDDPELYWLGKYDALDAEERLRREVHSLYMHERIDPQRLISRWHTARLNDSSTGSLFAPPLETNDDELSRTMGYYHHEEKWENRFINGDSLEVMNSLLQRESLGGKVQCIYFDPPYGIGFGSNWQLTTNNIAVKPRDISREPATIKAFRDTWELGIHSYLSYLRDRLAVAHELLNNSGSIFVQISDENVHLVRCVLDEVFGSENCVSQIIYQKTSSSTSALLSSPLDYILWYAKDKSVIKFNSLFVSKVFNREKTDYNKIELSDGSRMSISDYEAQKK